MRTLLTWVDRRQALPAQQILAAEPGRSTELARNLLDGIVATDERELSGIWSTASGSLTGFRTDQALDATADPDFDPAGSSSPPTPSISPPRPIARRMVAPMVVGLIEDIRQATYARARRSGRVRPRPPVVLALDEVANIAPFPIFPSMISEGGGQGLVDAGLPAGPLAGTEPVAGPRRRVPLPVRDHGGPPGIGDVRTLEALSTLAGDEEIPTRTVSAGRMSTDHPFTDLVTGGRPQRGESVSTQWRRAAAGRRDHPGGRRSCARLRRTQPAGVGPARPLLRPRAVALPVRRRAGHGA